jgi:esterase/lipase
MSKLISFLIFSIGGLTVLWADMPRSGSAKSCAIVVHGLNTNPDKMEGLAQLLRHSGIEVENLVLHGHNKQGFRAAEINRETWIQDAREAYDKLKTKCPSESSSLFLLGYSLGALIFLDAMNESPKMKFNKMVLLAPAVTPRFSSALIHCFVKFFGRNFRIPSLSPVNYRVAKSIPLAAYDALGQSAKRISNQRTPSWNIPTIVWIDPKDELVSSRKLSKWISRQSLSEWQLMFLPSKRQAKTKTWHHLIIDEEVLGTDAWTNLTRSILSFLSKS